MIRIVLIRPINATVEDIMKALLRTPPAGHSATRKQEPTKKAKKR